MRELRNTIERAIGLIRSGLFQVYDLDSPSGSYREPDSEPPLLRLADVAKRHIEMSLEQCDGRVSECARVLGIGKSTLYSKIAEYGLSVEPR